jgi:2-succinyl-5-enolpyruvyl-6-hydroxy-3-cyclohexene-1-carboxylate synthase
MTARRPGSRRKSTGTVFFSHLGPAETFPAVAPVPRFVPDVHGVIVVGPVQPADPDAFAAAVGEIARRLGWPVLADGVSPLRTTGHGSCRI